MFDLEMTEDQRLVHETVATFAREEIRPIAHGCDEAGEIPATAAEKGFDLGLVHSALPEEFGGFGEERSAVTGAIVAEELGWGDLSIALHLLSPRLVAYPVLDFGSPEQRTRWLPRFCERFRSAAAAVVEPRFDFDTLRYATTARRDDGTWTLNGAKCFVPLADDSEVLLLFAELQGDTSRPQGAFLVERSTPGLVIGEREKNMGLKALATHEVTLQDVVVPATARLGDGTGADLSRILDLGKVALASLAVGLARGAYEYARDYAKERRAFGVPIAQKQTIAFMLAEMAIEIDATRLLVWEAAWALDQGRDATRECALAKRYAASMALKVTDNALQVLGGHGYVRDHPVEMWLRNARGFATLEGIALV
jgi:acyl-CoA dehydrogenase